MQKRITLAAAFCLLLTVPALADWDPGTSAKWIQMPDLSDMGIDVCASPQQGDYILADDFLCTERGLITGIHIWGSWLNDYVGATGSGADVTFTLSIHADIPAEQNPDGYSKPGEVLWFMDFQPGTFVARVFADDLAEGFMWPPDEFVFPGDTVCWQYNFDISPDMAFLQEGSEEVPIVYWLDVKAFPMDEMAQFGWKTSEMHWNDNAVWGLGLEPYPGPWWELVYPPGHEMQGQPIDLSFVIEGEEQIQDADWGDAPASYQVTLANNGARHTALSAFYMGNIFDVEANGQPSPDATGDDVAGFDDEDGVVIGPLMPGVMTQMKVIASANGLVDAWIDYNADGDWLDAGEMVFSGSQSVVPGPNILTFTPPASLPVNTISFARVRFSSTGILTPGGPAVDGEVEDYQVRFIETMSWKWLQPPDLGPMGIDINASPRPEEYILADDFLCERTGPITDIHVFGSWLDDYIPFGEDPRAVKFTLSFHTDVPADTVNGMHSYPGEVLWVRDFQPGEFEVEIVAEQIMEGWMNPPEDYWFPADTICWLYKFHVDPHDAFIQRGTSDEPFVYWLDVKAEPMDPEAMWGWKTSIDHWNDDAVWGIGWEPYPGPWWELIYPPNHEMAGMSIDLAFELYEDRVTPVPMELPGRSQLRQNVPNPFNPQTVIEYVLPDEDGYVKLEIIDARGRIVRSLVDERQGSGPHTVTWFGKDDTGRELPSGVYFYRLHAPGCEESMKMVLLR